MKINKDFQLILGSLFLALALALPVAFHLVGLGSAFLPMFYPVVLAGFLLGPGVSITISWLAPLLSAALTGMPPFYPPIAFIMVLEFQVMVILAWLLFQKLKLNIYLSLALVILAERLVLLLSTWVTAVWLKLPGAILGPLTLLRGWPGLVILFMIIPPLVLKIRKKLRLSPFNLTESTPEREFRLEEEK